MGNLILICLVCVAFYIIKTQHIKVKIKTFFKKGFAPNRGQFGVYCFCGKQGQGKTYSVVEFLKENRDKEIYANLNLLKVSIILILKVLTNYLNCKIRKIVSLFMTRFSLL